MNRVKYIFKLITIVAGFISCSEHDSDKEKKWNLVLRDGLLYTDSLSTKPFTGHYKGKVLGRDIEYDVVDGKKHGIFVLFGENGNVETIGHIENDKNHGEWKYYYPNGLIESIGKFNNDKPDSVWNWFYITGTLMQEGKFNHGLKVDDWNHYDDLGNLYLSVKYKDDVAVDSIVYQVNRTDGLTPEK